MSNGMTQQQLADRLALIKEIYDTKYGGKMKRNVRASSERVSQYAKKSHVKTSDWFTPPKERTPDHMWTDASRYAEEYYGERMRQTTWHDNEWD